MDCGLKKPVKAKILMGDGGKSYPNPCRKVAWNVTAYCTRCSYLLFIPDSDKNLAG